MSYIVRTGTVVSMPALLGQDDGQTDGENVVTEISVADRFWPHPDAAIDMTSLYTVMAFGDAARRFHRIF